MVVSAGIDCAGERGLAERGSFGDVVGVWVAPGIVSRLGKTPEAVVERRCWTLADALLLGRASRSRRLG